MEYKLLLAKRSDPRFRIKMVVEVINPDKERYLQQDESLFDDYGISAFLADLDKHFMVSEAVCTSIRSFEDEAPNKRPVRRKT